MFKIRKESFERERKGLDKSHRRKRFDWDPDSDSGDYTEFEVPEAPSDKEDVFEQQSRHSDTSDFDDQHAKSALENYEYYCRNINRIKEKKDFHGNKNPNPLIEFLSAAEKEKVMMKGMGISNKKSKANNIEMKSFFMNQQFANAFTKGLKTNSYVEKLTITANSLTDQKLHPIIMSLPDNLKYLDISGNPALTKASYELIAGFISKKTSLISLGMEDC